MQRSFGDYPMMRQESGVCCDIPLCTKPAGGIWCEFASVHCSIIFEVHQEDVLTEVNIIVYNKPSETMAASHISNGCQVRHTVSQKLVIPAYNGHVVLLSS